MAVLLYLALVALGLAIPFAEKRATSPTVTIDNGTVVGSTTGVVDSFKGIPFAEPPTGTLRLRPPSPISSSFGTVTATAIPSACPQFYTQIDTANIPQDVVGEVLDSPLFQRATVTSEDCLTLNVQRPSTATSSPQLPVLFYIYGGGFEAGSTQMYDGTGFVAKSISLGQPIIFVAVNYRLGGFGFLAGTALQNDGSTNLGLRDQRLGLQWVADNIEAFGGDPSKVTIWGESAGAISVFDQLLINGGDNTYNGQPLFRAAIMDSGSAIPAVDVASAKAQNVYDIVVSNAGCSSSADALSCLRSLSYNNFLNAANSVPGIFSYSSLDLSYLPRPDPHDIFFPMSADDAISQGKYAKVPFILGDQEDEGTLFSLLQSNVTNTDDVVTYLASYFPGASQEDVAGLVATYPDDPSAGSPFDTGVLNNIYPEFKRLAAILGDVTFTLARRSVLSDLTGSGLPAWSYLSTFFYGTPILGTFHGSDVLEAYEDIPFPTPATSFQTYYVSFVNNLDPNAITTAAPLIEWPQWSSSDPQLIEFQQLSNTLTPDDFRPESYEYLMSHTAEFRV